MTDFGITVTAPGRLEAHGAMSYESAARALQAGLALIPHGSQCTIDLSKVSEADSAGLAVLVVLRTRAVARISDLDELLTAGK